MSQVRRLGSMSKAMSLIPGRHGANVEDIFDRHGRGREANGSDEGDMPLESRKETVWGLRRPTDQLEAVMNTLSSNGRVPLEVLSVASPCEVPWEAMAGDERSR